MTFCLEVKGLQWSYKEVSIDSVFVKTAGLIYDLPFTQVLILLERTCTTGAAVGNMLHHLNL